MSLRHTYLRRGFVAFLLVTAPLVLVTTTSVQADDFTVTDAGDAGPNTLRQALLDAQPGTDNVITVAPGLGTIGLASALTFNSNANLTIHGNGVVVNANGSNGVLLVDGDGDLSIDGMTFTGANASGSDTGALVKDGGAGDVDLTNCSVSGNTVAGTGETGALLVLSGATSITGCSISDNHISSTGSGDVAPLDAIGGALTVRRSNLSGNTVTAGEDNVIAGAIIGEGGPIEVAYSSITGNTATGTGTSADTAGAIASEGGTLTITNSTISGNSASAPVGSNNNTTGGLLIFASDGGIEATGLAMVYVTLTNNTGGAGGNILGERNATSFGTVITGATPNCSFDERFAMASNGYNFSDDASCGLTSGTDKESAGTPHLLALAPNGGPGPTQLPELTSPLVDAIPLASCQADGAAGITTDERGVARPQMNGCDIGAVELEPPAPPTPEPEPTPIPLKFTG